MRINHELGGLTLIHFECFIRVAELGTTLKAAEMMNLSQPLVSQKLAQLEKAAGVELFARQKRRLILTEAGQIFLEYTKRMLTDLNQKVYELQANFSTQMTKSLRIGFSDGQETSEIRTIMELFSQQFPEIAIDMVIESRVFLSEKLLSGDLDLCMVIDTEKLCENDKLCYQTLFSLPLNCIIHKNSALAQKEHLTYQDLENCSCYWPTCLQETQCLKDIKNYFQEQDIHVAWKYKDVDYYTLRRYLYEENSILLTSSQEVEDSSLKLYYLGGVYYPLIIVWKKTDTIPLKKYIDTLTKILYELIEKNDHYKPV